MSGPKKNTERREQAWGWPPDEGETLPAGRGETRTMGVAAPPHKPHRTSSLLSLIRDLPDTNTSGRCSPRLQLLLRRSAGPAPLNRRLLCARKPSSRAPAPGAPSYISASAACFPSILHATHGQRCSSSLPGRLASLAPRAPSELSSAPRPSFRPAVSACAPVSEVTLSLRSPAGLLQPHHTSSPPHCCNSSTRGPVPKRRAD